MTDSLAFNNRTDVYPGLAGLGGLGFLGANTAVIDATRTAQSGDVKALFLNPEKGNFRLLPTASAAIGQGGFTAGESTTDIDGEDRSGAPTDLGADEYNNAAPTAKIALATATPRSSQPVTFDGRGSSDREGNATIAQYRWRFSDGTAENTTQPFVQHTFAAEGDAAAGLIVVDAQGAESPEVVVTFKLVNGTPPGVAIVKPKSKQTFRTFTTTTKTVTTNGKKVKTKTRTRTKIQIAGLSKAKVGAMQRVLITLQKLELDRRIEDEVPLLRRLEGAAPRLLLQAEAHHGAARQGQRQRRVDLQRADLAAAVARQLEGLGLRCRHHRRLRQLRGGQGGVAELYGQEVVGRRRS